MASAGMVKQAELRRMFQGKEWITEDLLDDLALDAAAAEKGHAPEQAEDKTKPLSLAEFVKTFWPILEPDTPMQWGWALDAICLHLEAAARRKIKKLIINVPPGTMKPVYNLSMLVEKTRGSIPIKDVAVGDMVLTHRGRFRRVSAVHHQGVLPMLEITTRKGRKIKLAYDHPVLTARGWIQAQHLTLEDVLAEVHPQEEHGSNAMSAEEARLLGYLIGDGGVSSSATYFNNQDETAVADFRACASALGFETTMLKRPPSYEEKVKKETHRVSLVSRNDGSAGWRSAVQDWRKRHGLHRENSATKRVPAEILAASPEVIAEFLAAYWSCDGLISERRDVPRKGREGQTQNLVRVDCTTISEGLASDLQHLLSRLGLSFTLSRKSRKLSAAMLKNQERVGQDYAYYVLGADSQDTCAKFMQVIGCRMRHEKAGRAPGLQRTGFDHVLNPDRVLSIEKTHDGECMCLTVEDDHSFTVSDLAVHNTMLTAVFFPAWIWAELNPSERFLTTAFQVDLATQASVNMRRLVESTEYRERYGQRVRLMRDQNSKTQYDNTKRGRRWVKSMFAATGARGSILIIDDPNNSEEIDSKAHRAAVKSAYDGSLSQRTGNRKAYVQIVIQQRLHEDDLTGHLEKRGGWVMLKLPEEFEPETPTVTRYPDGRVLWRDPRTERGELLFANYRGPDEVAEAKSNLGSFKYAAQFQQRPVPAGGGIIKTWWYRYHAPEELLETLARTHPLICKKVNEDGSVTEFPALIVPTPAQYDYQLTSWDMAFKETKDSDFVVGQSWGMKGAGFYLRQQTRARLSFVKTVAEVKRFAADVAPDASEHLVEDKANGPAVLSALQAEIPAMIPIEPEGSKESRVNAESPTFEAGNVYLPHPALCPWVESEYIPEMTYFPLGANDDQVDATMQAIKRLKSVLKRMQKHGGKPKGPFAPPVGLAGVGGKSQSKWRT